MPLPFLMLAACAQAPTPTPTPTTAPSGPAPLVIGEGTATTAELQQAHPQAAAALQRGLTWLAAQQQADGRWLGDVTDRGVHDVALTGMSMLALARGGDGEDHTAAIQRGAEWLARQREEHGRLGTAAAPDYIYDHAIGTLGLWAAVAITGSGAAREAAQQATDYLESHRNPYAVWRYQPRDNDNDTSVTTWATLANVAAHTHAGTVNATAFSMVLTWLDQVTGDDGRTGYTKRGEPSSRLAGSQMRFPSERGEAMTAAGLLCRALLGRDPSNTPAMAKSIAVIAKKPPTWEPKTGKVDPCYWFFATEALRHLDGEQRARWNGDLASALVAGQCGDGAHAGSWDPIDPWGEVGGRIYTTGLSVLCLQAMCAVQVH